MNFTIELLASSERIVEWIDPSDHRLEVATGQEAPNDGGDLRDYWMVRNESERGMVVREVGRLVVAETCEVSSFFEPTKRLGPPIDPNVGTVVMTFDTLDDWATYFPVTEKTRIPVRNNIKAWAAVALCDKAVGLAVFSSERSDQSIQARIQPVPTDVFEKILS